jgi:hypothetical protein
MEWLKEGEGKQVCLLEATFYYFSHVQSQIYKQSVAHLHNMDILYIYVPNRTNNTGIFGRQMDILAAVAASTGNIIKYP